MTSGETIDIIARIALGGFMLASGIWLMRPRQNRTAFKLKRARRFGVSAAAMDALFKPCDNALFDGFNRAMAVFIAVGGLGILASGLPIPLPEAKSLGVLLAFGAVLATLLTGGLQLIFTAKAFVYMRRLYWVNPATWRPGWLTMLESVWGRLFGLAFTGLVGAIVYTVISTMLKGLA